MTCLWLALSLSKFVRLAGSLLPASRDVMFVVVVVFEVSLSKFVRLAGDLLPPPLFVPYVEMLTGLSTGRQCAHFGYALLKNNGSHSGTTRSAAVTHTQNERLYTHGSSALSVCSNIYKMKKMFNRQVDRPTRCRGTTSSCR